ncbi:unnamed protein product [Ostreobium quekettii]|uniref:Uncharacterized protein n=1 Tax=Ostreobium quekettii TaxID=121088 RepID=A0A8S1IPS0_9CHLO|nr:unnamed protein product [Ostreobium quekettii]
MLPTPLSHLLCCVHPLLEVGNVHSQHCMEVFGIQLFSSKLLIRLVVSTDYSTNSPFLNHCLVSFLKRLAHPEQLGLEPMLYQLSVLQVFHRIILDREIRGRHRFEEMVKLCTEVVGNMFQRMAPAAESVAGTDSGADGAGPSQTIHVDDQGSQHSARNQPSQEAVSLTEFNGGELEMQKKIQNAVSSMLFLEILFWKGTAAVNDIKEEYHWKAVRMRRSDFGTGNPGTDRARNSVANNNARSGFANQALRDASESEPELDCTAAVGASAPGKGRVHKSRKPRKGNLSEYQMLRLEELFEQNSGRKDCYDRITAALDGELSRGKVVYNLKKKLGLKRGMLTPLQESKLSAMYEELKGQQGVTSKISEQLPGGFSVNQVRSMLKKRGLLIMPAKRARKEVDESSPEASQSGAASSSSEPEDVCDRGGVRVTCRPSTSGGSPSFLGSQGGDDDSAVSKALPGSSGDGTSLAEGGEGGPAALGVKENLRQHPGHRVKKRRLTKKPRSAVPSERDRGEGLGTASGGRLESPHADIVLKPATGLNRAVSESSDSKSGWDEAVARKQPPASRVKIFKRRLVSLGMARALAEDEIEESDGEADVGRKKTKPRKHPPGSRMKIFKRRFGSGEKVRASAEGEVEESDGEVDLGEAPPSKRRKGVLLSDSDGESGGTLRIGAAGCQSEVTLDDESDSDIPTNVGAARGADDARAGCVASREAVEARKGDVLEALDSRDLNVGLSEGGREAARGLQRQGEEGSVGLGTPTGIDGVEPAQAGEPPPKACSPTQSG